MVCCTATENHDLYRYLHSEISDGPNIGLPWLTILIVAKPCLVFGYYGLTIIIIYLFVCLFVVKPLLIIVRESYVKSPKAVRVSDAGT